MKFYLYSVLNFICYFHQSTSINIKPELKRDILNFGYGINYKYEGMLGHLFDRFYVVTKFILPSVGDLNISTLNYDNTCAYLDNKNVPDTKSKRHMLDLMTFCKKIDPFVLYYKRLIKSYNNTAHNILENEINLILPQILRKQKCGIITMLVSSFIGLAYEGMLKYGIYNAEMLEKLINTVHNIHNTTFLLERLFAGQQSSLTLRSLYAKSDRFIPLLCKFTAIFKNSAR